MKTGHHGALRVGRVARWQRRAIHGVMGLCGISGLVWWLLLDGLGWPPPRLVFWWVLHGSCGMLALVALGLVLPQHVPAAWRHRRNRVPGALTLSAMVLAAGSALLLLYGNEAWHPAVHWLHTGMGGATLLAFAWHVLHGRRSIGQRP
ncbi:hypothetical protein GT347_25325 [Xylophilus rhododendri]|uniref:Transmembrane protein n=1 Tax=Xylophilus rhododendri TaxID=2697032 RepID=A0A857JEB2_9BURK|nr:hypothetical protein [Xylophilus rhododendri]QHJ01016.1 hypothetical protein GT347_25325 [Xylophilus rhododendri]